MVNDYIYIYIYGHRKNFLTSPISYDLQSTQADVSFDSKNGDAKCRRKERLVQFYLPTNKGTKLDL